MKPTHKNKTLIILGNGFDLDLGWKTSYNHFYQANKQHFFMLDRMSFIKDMVISECWYDLEGYLRRIAVNEVTTKDKIKELSHFWRFTISKLEEYFRDDSIYSTNANSCAFEFLGSITNNSEIVSFNYTNPFSKCNIKTKEIEYIHNSICSTFRCEGEIKLGIDKNVLIENNYLKESEINYIIKSEQNQIGDNLIAKWKQYDNIVIYGHSLGITDSDYFKPLFDSILSNICFSEFCCHVGVND